MVNSVSGLNNEFIFPSTVQADLWLFSHGSDQNKLHPFCCFKFLIAFCKIKVCHSFVDINLMHNNVHMMVRNLQLIMLRYSTLINCGSIEMSCPVPSVISRGFPTMHMYTSSRINFLLRYTFRLNKFFDETVSTWESVLFNNKY